MGTHSPNPNCDELSLLLYRVAVTAVVKRMD
jgi:hypothetical protein